MWVSTCIHFETAGSESYYPQVRDLSSTESFHSVYWRAAIASLATSIRVNPEARHTIFTNVHHPPSINGIDCGNLLMKLGIELIVIPFSFDPPPSYTPRFRSAFYLFDAMQFVSRNASDDELCLFTDPDCVWLRGAGAIARDVGIGSISALRIDRAPDEDVNGSTLNSISAIVSEILPGSSSPINKYYGGEFLAARGASLHELLECVEGLWQIMLDRHALSKPTLRTEEHFLTVALNLQDGRVVNADKWIRRIWTGLPTNYNNVEPTDLDLVMMHLPREKRYGFPDFFRDVGNPKSKFWAHDPNTKEYRAYLGEQFGIPRKSLHKLISDVLRHLSDVRTQR